ncbi:cytochrome P450 2C20-like [Ciona intestinalis]
MLRIFAFASQIHLETLLTSAAILTCFLFVVYDTWWRFLGTSGTLRGRNGFPVLGCFPLLGKNKERVFMDWSRTIYGPIYYARLGASRVLVLNGYEAVREALVLRPQAFAGRCKTELMKLLYEGQHGIMQLDHGPMWKEQRKFGQNALGSLGMGKRSLQSKMVNEFNCLSSTLEEELSANGSKGVYLDDMLWLYAANVISLLIFNESFDPDNEKWFGAMRENIRSHTARRERFLYLLMYVPFLKNLPLVRQQLNVTIQGRKTKIAKFKQFVENHRQSRDPEDPRDFIDCYLNIMDSKSGEDSFTEKQLLYFMNDLFLAGTETSSNTNSWAILLLLKNPEVMKRLRNEIDFLGREPALEDEYKMPYTRAVMQEIFRYRPALPCNIIPRKTTTSIQLNGHSIPAGMPVIANIWSVHHDPVTWAPDPETFRPERHLNRDGEFMTSDHVMPFSVGLRSCIGRNLARNELFIFLTSILRKFNLEFADGCYVDDMTGESGLLLHPPSYKVKGSLRV